MTKPHHRIRAAAEADIPRLIDLIQKTIESYGYLFELDFELPDFLDFNGFYGPKAELYVVEEDGEIAGCGALKGIGETPFLSRIYVDEAFRGRGYGKAVVLHLMRRAVELGHQDLELWSDTKFRTAHRMYERLGFRFTGRVRPLHDVNNCFEYHYVLDPAQNPYLESKFTPNLGSP